MQTSPRTGGDDVRGADRTVLRAAPAGPAGVDADLQGMSQRTPGILLGLGAIVVCLGLRAGGAFERVELAVHDRALGDEIGSVTATSPVALVRIGESDFERFGYPIPDATLARALDALAEAGAVGIGIDLYRDRPAGAEPAAIAGWSALAAVVRARPEVVVSELLGAPGERAVAAPDFADPGQIGFNNLLLDPGRVVRRAYLFAWDDDGTAHTSLSLQLALRHLSRRRVGIGPAPENADWIAIGDTTVPPLEPGFGAYAGLDAGGYQAPLDYARADEAFSVLGFADVVDGRFDAAALAGRVAIVGTDAPSVKDDFNAPISRVGAVKGFRIHAHATDQLIRFGLGESTPRTDWNEGAELVWIVGWGLAGIGLSMLLTSLGWAVPAFLFGTLLVYAFGTGLFAAGTWVPTAAPAFAWLAAGGLAVGDRARREAREQRQLMSLFRRFSSRRVADALWSQRDEFMDGHRPRPQRVTITALLSDLKGYTAASEKMPPDQLMDWIDSYMDAMTRVIESYDGHVDDYVGDGIKANFGVPVPSESEVAIAEDARRAVRCAIEMGRTLERLNAEWTDRGWPTGRQRIGLFTGEAVVGAIGSEHRTKYTSVGDTINTAARLEGIGGALDFDRETALQRILIGARTRALLGDGFEVEDLGAHAVKGKSEPLAIYRVHGERPRDAEEQPS